MLIINDKTITIEVVVIFYALYYTCSLVDHEVEVVEPGDI